MSQLSESGHAQNQDVKGKLYENAFSVPIVPTRRESLHDSYNTIATTTRHHSRYHPPPPHDSPSTDTKRMLEAAENATQCSGNSINQSILIERQLYTKELCNPQAMHVTQVISESHRSCSVFKNLLLNCGNEKNPHHPTLLRTFYWLSSSREREAWRSWKLSLNCSPFTHAQRYKKSKKQNLKTILLVNIANPFVSGFFMAQVRRQKQRDEKEPIHKLIFFFYRSYSK